MEDGRKLAWPGMIGMIAFSIFFTAGPCYAAWWNANEPEKEEKPIGRSTAVTQPADTLETGKVIETPPGVTSALSGLRAAKSVSDLPQVPDPLRAMKLPNTEPAAATHLPQANILPNADLEPLNAAHITKMQRELELLSNEYEDLRVRERDQLVALRALSSQAKIHAQVLEDIKASLPPALPGGAAVPDTPGLDALSLEKYRLIRERLNAQRGVLTSITARQQNLADAISRARSIPKAELTQPLAINNQVKDLKTVKTAVADAKKEMKKTARPTTTGF